MKITVLAVGQKMPKWVVQGVEEYTKRLPSDVKLHWQELAPGHRGKSSSVAKAKQQEAQLLQKHIADYHWVVVLDLTGKPWSHRHCAINCRIGRIGSFSGSGHRRSDGLDAISLLGPIKLGAIEFNLAHPWFVLS